MRAYYTTSLSDAEVKSSTTRGCPLGSLAVELLAVSDPRYGIHVEDTLHNATLAVTAFFVSISMRERHESADTEESHAVYPRSRIRLDHRA